MIHWIGSLLQEKLFWSLSLDGKWGGAWLYFNLTSWGLNFLSVNLNIPYLVYKEEESGKEHFAQWSLDVGTHIGPLDLSFALWEPDEEDEAD